MRSPPSNGDSGSGDPGQCLRIQEDDGLARGPERLLITNCAEEPDEGFRGHGSHLGQLLPLERDVNQASAQEVDKKAEGDRKPASNGPGQRMAGAQPFSGRGGWVGSRRGLVSKHHVDFDRFRG